MCCCRLQQFAVCVILACALTSGVQQLIHCPPQSSSQKKHRSQVAVMLKTKLKRTILREFLATGGCFKQHLLHYGARLAEEGYKQK